MTEVEYESVIAKQREQIESLENEIRKYPTEATEVANLQTAVYGMITEEIEELAKLMESEKREFEQFKERHQARADRLLERRQQLMRSAGANIEDMSRRALANRPEDPRTTLLRKEFDEYRDKMERLARNNEEIIRNLRAELNLEKNNAARSRNELNLDATQLQRQVTDLQNRLAEKDRALLSARQRIDELQQAQSFHQQQLMAKLARLESPSIGTVQSMSTNQTREAKMVKIPSWMRLGK